MKYYIRSKQYRASNVILEVNPLSAWSYAWWKFLARINGAVVFNGYNYSNSTCRHQSKVKAMLDKLGINIDLYIECPSGLQSANWLESTIEYHSREIQKLREAIANPRSRAETNKRRITEIEAHQVKIDTIQELTSRKVA